MKHIQKTAVAAALMLSAALPLSSCSKAEKAAAPDLKALEDKAAAGDPAAANDLGEIYAGGALVPADYGAAYYWYKKSAEKNYPRAVFNIGVMKITGRGIEQDKKEGCLLVKKAEDLGSADAKKARPVILSRRQNPERRYADVTRNNFRTVLSGRFADSPFGSTCETSWNADVLN